MIISTAHRLKLHTMTPPFCGSWINNRLAKWSHHIRVPSFYFHSFISPWWCPKPRCSALVPPAAPTRQEQFSNMEQIHSTLSSKDSVSQQSLFIRPHYQGPDEHDSTGTCLIRNLPPSPQYHCSCSCSSTAIVFSTATQTVRTSLNYLNFIFNT